MLGERYAYASLTPVYRPVVDTHAVGYCAVANCSELAHSVVECYAAGSGLSVELSCGSVITAPSEVQRQCPANRGLGNHMTKTVDRKMTKTVFPACRWPSALVSMSDLLCYPGEHTIDASDNSVDNGTAQLHLLHCRPLCIPFAPDISSPTVCIINTEAPR
ncbi:hypothetical protein Y032_0051g2161 [Ancylostoma ceylanicum]|uniref:Uncharacterized protein n=1 Tax=Ancylostoma ceylanicum TaxID=53326 RepID=A0A016U7P8_9BILA|nr:hypothetical protein Y032_0051g2161 [Ancylostoma ceylanicum]